LSINAQINKYLKWMQNLLKIHQTFTIKFFILFAGTILISCTVFYISLKSIIIQHNKHHLQDVISLVSMDINKANNLDKLVKNIYEKTDLRVTIINNDGEVIAESNADKMTMDNHLLRDEILNATSSSYGQSIRYSNTTKVNSLYVAKKIIYKKQEVFLRISKSITTIMESFYDLYSKLSIVLVLMVFSILYITRKMGKRLVYDIEQIISYLSEISNKNYEAVIQTKYFQEFLQISLLLKDLVKKLDKRDRQKRKYTAKLRLINKQRDVINFSEFDLSVLCNKVAINLNSKYKDRKILVNVKSTKIIADKTMIELVIINLVDNALKFSKSDVKVFLEKNRLSVQDKGIGIKEEHIAKITAKFYQVDKNSLDNSVGIGLAIVSNILKASSSSLEIKSVFGEGSVFSFSVADMSI